MQPLAQQPIFTNNSVRPVEQLTQQSNNIAVPQNSMQMPASSQLLQNGALQLSYKQPNTLLVSNSTLTSQRPQYSNRLGDNNMSVSQTENVQRGSVSQTNIISTQPSNAQSYSLQSANDKSF